MSQEKVTTRIVKYPKGLEPDMVLPTDYCAYRLAIGHIGQKNLAVLGMNPSAAREEYSDATVNRIIHIAQQMHCDGWIMFNVYPERATDAKNLEPFNETLHRKNADAILSTLRKNKIDEIWGAWGDLKHATLKTAKEKLIPHLQENGIKIFYFSTLTKLENPRHPLYLKVDIDDKNYL